MLKLGVSPAGVLLWSGLFFFLSGEEFLSLAAAVFWHELGHVAALKACGAGIDALCLTGTGLRMDYLRPLAPREDLICALAGPAAGALWFLAAAAAGAGLSAGMSLLLSAFNLLPFSCMDGGRALHAAAWLAAGERRADAVSAAADAAVSLAALIFAAWCAGSGYGLAPALAAVWMIWRCAGNCRMCRPGGK